MRIAVVVAVLLMAAVFGAWWRVRRGRVHTVRVAPETPVLAALGVEPATVTLLQFSSAFCAPCRATRVVLGEVAAMLPAVRHVEVDAESHLGAVRELGIVRTPTVLVIDSSGAIVKRASGLPRKADVIAAVAPLLPHGAADKPDSETALPDTGTAGT